MTNKYPQKKKCPRCNKSLHFDRYNNSYICLVNSCHPTVKGFNEFLKPLKARKIK